jgi:hypothetical protein
VVTAPSVQAVPLRWVLRPGSAADGHGTPASFNARAIRAALRQLVLQAPAPVIATMLGYSHEGTAQVAAEVGSPWSRYAPGDHARPRSREGNS